MQRCMRQLGLSMFPCASNLCTFADLHDAALGATAMRCFQACHIAPARCASPVACVRAAHGHRQGQRSVASPCHSLPQLSGTDMCIGACSQVRTMAAASSDWLAEDKRLMLHAVYRVGDLEKTEVSTMH